MSRFPVTLQTRWANFEKTLISKISLKNEISQCEVIRYCLRVTYPAEWEALRAEEEESQPRMRAD